MTPGRPSATAMLVAASVVRRGAAHRLPPVAIELARRALALGAANGSLVARLALSRCGRALLAGVEALVLPGLAEHHCARKAWIWQRLQADASPERQFVWLGVGFDGLGQALLSARPDTRVIETDHPDTLWQRRALVDDHAARMQAMALPGELPALAALCAARPTTLVCEGVLMYLPRRVVVRALRRLAALPQPPDLVFTALDTVQPQGRGFRRPATLVRRWLQRHGEPFRWRATPERVRRCLAAAGYRVSEAWDGGGYGEFALAATSGCASPMRIPSGPRR